MRVTGSGAYARPPPTPKMPPGLIELMEGLAKDVLKNNPEDVYEFCAGHMQKLLEIRDGTVPKKQLTLDEKIKRAQEKIRQRIKDRELRNQKESSELSIEAVLEKKEEPNNQASVETLLDDTSSLKQPVLDGGELIKTSEFEIFHEPDVTITTTDNKDKLLKKDEVKECPPLDTETMQDSKIITAVKEEVKESNVDVKSDTSSTLESLKTVDLKDKAETKQSGVIHEDLTPAVLEKGLDKEEEPSELVIEQDTPAPSEADQTEASTNDVEEKLNKKNDESESVLNSSILKNEGSELEVVVREIESIDNTNAVMVSEIKVVDKPEDISAANHDSISDQTKNTDTRTKSEEMSKPTDSNIDVKEEVKESNVDVKSDSPSTLGSLNSDERTDEEKNTVTDDQKITKNKHQAKDAIPDQELKENFEIENVPSDVKNSIIEIEKVNEDKEANLDQTNDASKSDDNKQMIKGEKNIDNITAVNESKIEKGNSNESLFEFPLQSSATSENQSSVKRPEPPAETIMPVKLVTSHEVLPTTTQENSNDYIDDNGHHSDIDAKYPAGADIDKNVTDEKHQHAEKNQLFVSEIIQNNAFDPRKNDITTESDEPIQNAEGNGMDLETAAITIQKVFRTFLFSKSRASTLEDTANDNSLDEEIEKKDEPEYIISSANLNKERRTLGISRMDTVLQTVNEEKSLSLSDDSSTLSSAATTIQAHVRGFLVRNRLTSYKTASNSSLVNSEGPSTKSLDGDANEPKKTILNIHIVPERGQYMSRDESMLTSIDLPLDNSPPSSINLHPLGYDKSEPRKQLKREDAIQSISPPSNNSGKLSEDVDSVKDSLESKQEENLTKLELKLEDNPTITLMGNDKRQDMDTESCDTTLTISSTADTVVDAETYHAREALSSPEHNSETDVKNEEATNFSSDELDVVTPFPNAIEKPATEIESDDKPKLVHTGEFHDVVLQTQVKRSESSVVREFKNVLVYFLLWDKT